MDLHTTRTAEHIQHCTSNTAMASTMDRAGEYVSGDGVVLRGEGYIYVALASHGEGTVAEFPDQALICNLIRRSQMRRKVLERPVAHTAVGASAVATEAGDRVEDY